MKQNELGPSVGFNLAASLCMLVSIGAIWLVYEWEEVITKARVAQSWSTTQGEVIVSTVQQNCGRSLRDKFYPNIRYTYQVNGRIYESGTYEFGIRECDEEAAIHSIANRYVPGASVTVWFNPDNVEDATLVVGDVTKNTMENIHGTLLFLAFILPLSGWCFYKGRS